jgi:cytochrome c553
LGKRIYTGGIVSKGVPACAGCHSPTGAGIPNKYPRVSGQFADYSVQQLKAFREDVRTNSPQNQMQDIAKRLTDAEIKAVSDYMAGVR